MIDILFVNIQIDVFPLRYDGEEICLSDPLVNGFAAILDQRRTIRTAFYEIEAIIATLRDAEDVILRGIRVPSEYEPSSSPFTIVSCA